MQLINSLQWLLLQFRYFPMQIISANLNNVAPSESDTQHAESQSKKKTNLLLLPNSTAEWLSRCLSPFNPVHFKQ